MDRLPLTLSSLNPTVRRAFEREVFKYLGVVLDDDHPIWDDEAQEVLITGGWRAGKTVSGAAMAFKEGLNPKTKLIWLIGPDYSQATEEIRYIFEWATKLNFLHPTKRPSLPAEGSRSVTLRTGCTIQTKSAKYPERLGSVAPDFVLLCEPGQTPFSVYKMAVGRLAEKRGKLWLAGTLEGEDGKHARWMWYEDLALQWKNNPPGSRERAYSWPSWKNTTIFPGGINDPAVENLRQKYSAFTFARKIAGEPVGSENPCLTLDTSILTLGGWKKHDELAIGEMVATYDPEIDSLKWAPLRAVVYNDNQPLVTISNRGFRFTATSNHPWAVSKDRVNGWTVPEYMHLSDFRRGSKFRRGYKLLVSAKLTDEQADGFSTCSPAEAGVLGWLITDGWITGDWTCGKSSVCIGQKNYCQELETDLNESGLAYTTQKGTVTTYRIASKSAREWLARIGYDKENLVALAVSLSSLARKRMLNAMLLADAGWQRNRWVFYQTSEAVLSVFQALATLEGFRLNTTLRKARVNSGGYLCKPNYEVGVNKRRFVDTASIEDAGHADTWCPAVDTHFVVARNNNQISITGNCLPRLWETDFLTTYMKDYREVDVRFIDGALGVDYGDTPDHPSAIVVIRLDEEGRYWIFECWTGGGNIDEIETQVAAFKKRYNIHRIRVDPNQRALAQRLGGNIAYAGSSMGGPALYRIGIANGISEDGYLWFNEQGRGVMDVFYSMRSMRRIRDTFNRLVYARDLGDDCAMAALYALEELHGETHYALPMELGGFKMLSEPKGRAGMVGRI